MEFQSLDDALMCYTNYAKHEGFGIRKSRILKSRKNQMVIGQEFVCSKEGYRAKKYLQRDNRKKPPPDETRMGCKAMISVSRKDEDKWVISKFTRDHNHVLAFPSSARFHRVHRKRTKSQRNLIDVLDESGIRPIQYDKALDARYNKEREKTFKTLNSKPILKTLYPMEEEASKVYTRKMFRMFQDELIHSQQFVAEKFITNEHESVYKVHEFDKEKPEYIVTFMSSSTTIECSCHMFEFLGILCRHQLMVLLKKNVYSLPKHYILQRWTTDAKKGEIRSTSNEEEMCGYNMCSTTLFNNIMVHSLELSEKASRSKKHYDTTIESLQCLFKKLDALKIDDDMTSSTGRLTSMTSNQDDDNNNVPMRDPPRVTTKGRPRSVRMKGALELKSNRVTCSTCKKKGHTKRTCTLKNKNMVCNMNIFYNSI
nr:protein FAR1-RELATED SEQUENCE 5-like [Ipomoea batatas]